jgi:hypothetical protein
MLQSAFADFRFTMRKFQLVNLRLPVAAFIFSIAFAVFAVQGQTPQGTPMPTPQPSREDAITADKIASGNLTGEQVAELSVAVYGYPNGRATLEQIRKTASERGKVAITNANGRVDNASYQRWYLRSDDGTERLRVDQQFPNARFSLINDSTGLFGVYNDSAFVPTADATAAFENQMHHSVDTYLRYKENGSTLVNAGREKKLGVDYHLIDLTDKQGRKTRYYVSAKSFRVMMLEYESLGAKYQRKFYDYRYAQGTLFPYRSVLSSGDRIVEETTVGTVTFGQKVSDGLFARP